MKLLLCLLSFVFFSNAQAGVMKDVHIKSQEALMKYFTDKNYTLTYEDITIYDMRPCTGPELCDFFVTAEVKALDYKNRPETNTCYVNFSSNPVDVEDVYCIE